MNRGPVLVLVLAFFFFAAAPAFADYTYYYTGPAFTEVYGTEGYSTSDRLTGWITTSSPIFGAGEVNSAFGLTGFSFTDGHQTIDSSNAVSSYMYLVGNGDVLAWLWSVTNANGTLFSCYSPGYLPGCGGYEAIDFTYRFETGSGGNVINVAGQWTTTAPVPEPSSLLMIAGGLCMLCRKLVPATRIES